MLIVGAKGFAKEVLEVVHQLNQLDNLTFYDDVKDDVPEKLFGQFPVLRTTQEASVYFKNVDNQIYPRRYFYPSLNTINYAKGQTMPISESIASRILCLPLYVGLSEEDLNRIRLVLENIETH